MKKNLKKVLLLIFVLALALPMYACSSNSPEAAAKDFVKAISDEDVDDFKDLLTEETLESFDMVKEMTGQSMDELLKVMLEEMNAEFEDEYGKNWHKDMKFKETENEDDEATVEVTMKGEDDSEEFYFIKEDGNWKLDFNK